MVLLKSGEVEFLMYPVEVGGYWLVEENRIMAGG